MQRNNRHEHEKPHVLIRPKQCRCGLVIPPDRREMLSIIRRDARGEAITESEYRD
jgi:hypothetical protein